MAQASNFISSTKLWQEVPDDCFQNVFKFLNDKELCKIRAVNPQFLSIVMDTPMLGNKFWMNIFYNDFGKTQNCPANNWKEAYFKHEKDLARAYNFRYFLERANNLTFGVGEAFINSTRLSTPLYSIMVLINVVASIILLCIAYASNLQNPPPESTFLDGFLDCRCDNWNKDMGFRKINGIARGASFTWRQTFRHLLVKTKDCACNIL